MNHYNSCLTCALIAALLPVLEHSRETDPVGWSGGGWGGVGCREADFEELAHFLVGTDKYKVFRAG